MKGRKIYKLVLCFIFALSMIFALAACMNEEDYYTKGDVDALVADLEAELSTKASETSAAISALKAEYEAAKSVLEATAKANTDKIVQLTVDYNVKVAALEKADADNTAALAELKAKYDADLAILNQADIDNAAAIAALDKEYNDKVAELEASLKSSTDTINILIGELKECDKATSETIAAMKTQIEMILAAMEKQYHTVTFVTGEGSTPPEKQSVVDGKKATKPADPIKKGYIFDGWYVDGEKWSFVGFVVTEDIELIATWSECVNHLDENEDRACDKCGAEVIPTDVYYSDFGARGDGVTDDFFAIKACHDYANLYGSTVHADPNAVYYIGRENGTQSIYIQTDTYWNGCTFIWDDSVIDKPGESKAYQASIFEITSDNPSYTLTGSKLPVTSVMSGATSIGDWKPSERVMVVLSDSTKRHYIRYGSNQNNGSAQVELVIVNPDGSIDPDTPIQWDYTYLSKMTVYPVNDTPITVSGGTKDQVDDYDAMGTFDNYHNINRTVIHTYFNTAPSEYNYHGRNIAITRSNVTIKNLEHILHDDVETSAPYTGWISVNNCTDVVVEGMIVQMQKGFATTGAAGTSVGMGSYEFNAGYANRLTWRHCRISNFFEEDGRVTYDGNMGTNYCKNLMFDDVVNHSFDAHCGLYNGTIKDSTIEHLNFIGGGTIKYENVTVYTDGGGAAMHLRSDYGSIWNGDVIIDGLTLKTSKASPTLSVIGATYTNHYFGYTCYLPKTVSINNAKIIRYSFEMKNGIRTEWDVAENHVPLHLYANLEKYKTVDISDPNADMSSYPNDYIKCNCEAVYKNAYPDDPTKWRTFNDTDGDGRCNNDLDPTDSYFVWCWGFENTPDKTINTNPYIPTEVVNVTNCGNLEVIVPPTPQFKDTKLYIDGVLQQ